MIDVLKYQKIIRKILSDLKVKTNDRQDMEQECYMALIKEQRYLEKADDELRYVMAVCRNQVWRIRQDENQVGRGSHQVHDESRRPPMFDSLSDPRTAYKVLKIATPAGSEVSEEKMYEAIYALPIEESRVIYNIFVDGKTQEETAADLGLSRKNVRTLEKRGIKLLKQFFEVV